MGQFPMKISAYPGQLSVEINMLTSFRARAWRSRFQVRQKIAATRVNEVSKKPMPLHLRELSYDVRFSS